MGRFNASARPELVEGPPPSLPSIASVPFPLVTVLPPPTTAAASPQKPKLNFAGLQKKEPAAVVSEYPVLPDPDGAIAQHAAAFLVAKAREEAANGAKESARGELVRLARPFHFTVNSGKADVPSSVSIASPQGEVRVTFKSAYKNLSDTQFEAATGIVGAEVAGDYFSETFEFSIKSENIPQARMQEVIDGITELAERLGIGQAVSVATCYKPTAEWHTARFRKLTPEQNLALEKLVDSEKGYSTVAVGPVRGKK